MYRSDNGVRALAGPQTTGRRHPHQRRSFRGMLAAGLVAAGLAAGVLTSLSSSVTPAEAAVTPAQTNANVHVVRGGGGVRPMGVRWQ